MTLPALALALLLFAPAAMPARAPAPLPPTGECSADYPRGCVERVYQAVYADSAPTLDELAVMTARAELGLFFDLGHGETAAEAFWRSWYDVQSGACRERDCGYANVIDYLTTSQVWRDAGHRDGTVDTRRLVLDEPFQDELFRLLADHPVWKTGQGAAVPSAWGNARLEAGTTVYPADTEVFAALIVHHYASGGYSFDGNVRAGEVPTCSLAAVIVSTEGRRPVGLCGREPV